ncbi:unnamed protein product [Cunninghamella echinulata]
MNIANLETVKSSLSALVNKEKMTIENPELDSSATFVDYNDWMTNEFNIESSATKPYPMRPQVLQWSPNEGDETTTISILLECNNFIQGSLKIVFGQLAIETICQVHSMPIVEQESNNWITLAAKVPKLQDVQTVSDCQVPVSICHFSISNPDLALDTWTIGAFTYLDQPSLARKRTASPNLSDDFPQKQLYSSLSTNDDTSVDSQFLQLLAPYEDPLSKELSSQSNQPNQNTALWLSQQLQQHRQQQQIFTPTKQEVVSPERQTQCHFFNHSTGLNGNISLPSEYSAVTSNKRNSQQQQNGLAYSHYTNINMGQQLSYPFGNRCNYNVSLPYYAANHPHLQEQLMVQKTPFNNNLYHPSNNNNNMSIASRKSIYNNNHDYNQHNNNNSINNKQHQVHHHQNVITTVHPFAGLLNKANLKICGDLMEMTFQWSANEWQSGRRLVRFWRRQNTNNVENSQQVECGFEPIEYYVHQQQMQQQQQRRLQFSSSTTSLSSSSTNTTASSSSSSSTSLSPNNKSDISLNTTTTTNSNNNTMVETNENGIKTSSLIVSCIYWRERNDYFITSVDCIYLLEGLIGVQFTVEEKNRIRRNLEGFRPLTVSKCKSDCADFFKLIMGFPHPKPRNIEKDVKVFAWKTLPHALRKIIRKYTPNYTNTTTPSFLSSSSSQLNHNSASSTSSLSSPPSMPMPPSTTATTTATATTINPSNSMQPSLLPPNTPTNNLSSNIHQPQPFQQYYF